MKPSKKQLLRAYHHAKRPVRIAKLLLADYLDNTLDRKHSAAWLTSPIMLRLALTLNVQTQRNANEDYEKFIVLTSPRSGSNLLCSSLTQHDNLVCRGELFGEDGPHIGLSPRNFNSNWLAMYRDRDAARFLKCFHFNPYPAAIHAVGFKVFPKHLMHNDYGPVISGLLADHKTKVIVLQRHNYLERYASFKKANASQQWANWIYQQNNVAASKPEPMELTTQELDLEFLRLSQEDQVIADLVKDRPYLQVNYDELAGDFESQLGRVQRYLGVPEQPVVVRTGRQRKGSIQENIANYAELKQYFYRSPWGRFFT